MPILTPTAEFDELASTLPEDVFTQERMNDFVRGVFRSAGSNTALGYRRFSPYPLSANAVDSLKSMWVERKMEERIYSYDEKTPLPIRDKGKNKGKPYTEREEHKFRSRYQALAKGSEIDFQSVYSLIAKKLHGTGQKHVEARLAGKEHKKDEYQMMTFNNMMSASTYKKLMAYGSFTRWTTKNGINPKTGKTKYRTVYVMDSIDPSYLSEFGIIPIGEEGFRKVDKFKVASRPEAYSRWHDWLNVYGTQSLNDSRTQEAIIRYMDKKFDAMVEEANRI